MPENATLGSILQRAHQTILPGNNGAVRLEHPPDGELFTGVDLGTANLVLVVLDSHLQPLAGEYQTAQVVRDGLVVDFFGAIARLKAMKAHLEARIGRPLTSAVSAYPPGVAQAEVRATANVVEAAGLECQTLVDEPSAANNLLGIQDGAIVDVGGGTTGIAVIENWHVAYTADEPTGGTHFTLVVAGAKNLSFEQAEAYKLDPRNQEELFPLLRPVMEKVASIEGMADVVQEITGIPTTAIEQPLFVTPIGIAMQQAQLN